MRKAIVFLIFAALLAACQHVPLMRDMSMIPDAGAGELPKKGKIAAPKQETPPPIFDSYEVAVPYKVHNWYMGVVGGYAWTPEGQFDAWNGGVVGGYLWRPNATLGLGVEADYVVRDLGSFAIDDAMASVRARMGLFIGQSFIYGTAGISEAIGDIIPDDYSRGIVVGGGIERDILQSLSLRLEALHYRHADDYLSWGDYGSTTARAGLVFKF